MARGGAVDFDLIKEAQKLAGNTIPGGPIPDVPQPTSGIKFPGGKSSLASARDAINAAAGRVRNIPGFGPNVGRVAGFARGSVPGYIAGETLAGFAEGAVSPTASALDESTRLQRAADIFFGAGKRVRAIPQNVLNLLGFGDVSPITRAGTEGFGVPSPPAQPTDKEFPSPTPPVEAAGGATQADDTTDANYRITNPDGSVSYTNVRKDVREAVNRGAGVLPMDETFESRGTVNTFKAPTALEHARARDLFLRDNDFAGARTVAQSEDDLRLINIKEQQFLNTDPRRAKELKKAEDLFYAQQSVTKAATIKAASDALKAGPEAAKNTAQALKTNLMLGLAARALKDDPKSANNVMRLLAGIAPESPKIHFTDPIDPSQPTQVTRVSPSGEFAERLPTRDRVAIRSRVTLDGKTVRVLGDGLYQDNKGTQYTFDARTGKLKQVK